MAQTEQEIRQAASDWATTHCPTELKTSTGGLNPDDARLIGEYIQNNHNGIWSVQTLNATVNALSSELHWRSKAEVQYDTAYSKLTPDQQHQFGSFWHKSAKKYVETNGEDGFENAAKILNWCVGKTFTPDIFDRAVGNLFSTVGLYPAPTREQGERRGHTDDGRGFMRKDEVNISAADRARRDHERSEQSQPRANPNDPNSAEWQRKADQLTGSTHSDKQILARMCGGTAYETYMMRQRYLNSKQRGNFNRTAV